MAHAGKGFGPVKTRFIPCLVASANAAGRGVIQKWPL